MATVEARKRKKGTVYCAEIRIKGHPGLSQTFERNLKLIGGLRRPRQRSAITDM
jgi:hypothetical protein